MPYLNSKSPNLQIEGPVIQVVIFPSLAHCLNLQENNRELPSFKARALIDTGASSSCITQAIVNTLNISPHDFIDVLTPAGRVEQEIYDIGIGLPISNNIIIPVTSPCANLSGQNIDVLLGRDILNRCTLFYNGADNSFVLHY